MSKECYFSVFIANFEYALAHRANGKPVKTCVLKKHFT